MMTTKKITDFNISWTADHEQYWRGHGICDPDGIKAGWTHCATGVGETLREAFEDALERLADSEGLDYSGFVADKEAEMLAELTSQVKEPITLNAPVHCLNSHPEPCGDCAVCAGEWHYYVMVDVKVE